MQQDVFDTAAVLTLEIRDFMYKNNNKITNNKNNLKSLIELYKDQVDLLKKELNHKNNIIWT